MYCTVPFVQNKVMNNTKGYRSGYSDMYEFSGSGSIGSDQAFVNLILYRFLKENDLDIKYIDICRYSGSCPPQLDHNQSMPTKPNIRPRLSRVPYMDNNNFIRTYSIRYIYR